MEVFYYLVFGGLAAVVAGLELGKSAKDRVTTSQAFNSFKNNYVLVYSLMMCMSFFDSWRIFVLPDLGFMAFINLVQPGTGCKGRTCTTSTASTASTRATSAASSSPASDPPCSSAPSSDHSPTSRGGRGRASPTASATSSAASPSTPPSTRSS
jgi:hypothetical protein